MDVGADAVYHAPTVAGGLSARDRTLVMGIRQVLIMALGLLEDWAGLPRSIEPKRKRGEASG